MEFRTKRMALVALGLFAVGTATGLTAPKLLQTAAPAEPPIAATTASATAADPIPLIAAPNYRAIVARNQAAVLGITTASEHVIAIRVYDRHENVATAKAVV